MEIKGLVLIFFLVVFLLTPNIITFILGGSVCDDRERKALLTFKQHLKDPYNHLSSWGGNEDCCGWSGVVCNNKTDPSFVVQLDLYNFYLSGDLNPSLLELKHLSHLDLSLNSFQGISIPAFLGSLQNLIYLDIAYSGFVGSMDPHQLGNLTNLIHLDVGGLSIDGDLEWLSNLTSLQYLGMNNVNLSKASSSWLHSLNMLPSLLELRLRSCELDSIPSLSYVNFTSLEILDLSDNKITSKVPKWLFNLTSLKQLLLNSNYFQGTIPFAVGDLTSLTRLDLSSNEFEGKVPRTLGNLCNLQRLNLYKNKLNGEISEFFRNSSGCIADSLEILNMGFNQLSGSISSSLGNYSLLSQLDLGDNKLNGSLPISLRLLTKLEYLKLSDNTFQGVVTELNFANLTSLTVLWMSSMVLKLRPDWIPPFQIEYLELRNCHLGSRFPEWLRTQKSIKHVDLSSNGISGTVPTWFWNLSSQVNYLNLSHNHLSGELPDLSNLILYGRIYLRSNMFEGQIPLISSDVTELDLSNNSISGHISALLCNTGNEMSLTFLDLSRNLLSGELSECWSNWKDLEQIILGSNAITGKIPNSIGSLMQLESLHLRNNSLYGELPSSLRNCTNMVTIDVGENEFTGKIPAWIGQSLPKLIILRLRLNKFLGSIPQELCHLSSLRLLDLAHNNLLGSIPRCFNNFSAMASQRNLSQFIFPGASYYGILKEKETALLVTKGREVEYGNTLALVTSMDLSKNNLSGEIPEELTSLVALRTLNLSENYFTGKIPEKIGWMNLLESIDFSNNKLSGLIPQSMANITFLSHLNLSYNDLSGTIPLTTQMQSFTELSYMGNQGLCGPPLLKKCNEQPQGPRDGENTEENEDWVEMMKWFYVSMSLGLVTGFWGFLGVLLVKNTWRYAYFRFVGDMIDKLNYSCSRFKIR